MACKNPIDFETLVAYWLGEVRDKREETLEEHLFGCAHCTKTLEGLAALSAGVAASQRRENVVVKSSSSSTSAYRLRNASDVATGTSMLSSVGAGSTCSLFTSSAPYITMGPPAPYTVTRSASRPRT